MQQDDHKRLRCDDGVEIAYRLHTGRLPTVVFLSGFASDMSGTKVLHLEAFCRARGNAFLRFDYQGHGLSSGRFEDGSIGTWAQDARNAIDALTEGPVVLVGSSMGGWIMLLAALGLGARVRGLVGIAAAPDFTETLIWGSMDEAQRTVLRREGVILMPSDYDEQPSPITLRLIEEGRDHLLLGGDIAIDCPVRLLQGLRDADVPWKTALQLLERLTGDDARMTIIKDGDHRLSRPQDLALLCATLAEFL